MKGRHFLLPHYRGKSRECQSLMFRYVHISIMGDKSRTHQQTSKWITIQGASLQALPRCWGHSSLDFAFAQYLAVLVMRSLWKFLDILDGLGELRMSTSTIPGSVR